MSKNLYPALTAILKANNLTLENEEFKRVLNLINNKEISQPDELSMVAKTIIRVFEQKDLKEDEFYFITDGYLFYVYGENRKFVAKNRTQLLDILVHKTMSTAHIEIQSFGAEFY